MAGSIGGVSCTFVKGQPPELKERSEVWTTPGFQGYGAQITGKSDAPFQFAAIQYDTPGAIEGWIAALRALQGTVQTITNDWGVATTNLLISSVGQPSKVAEVGNGGARGEIRISGVKVA